MEVFWEVPSLNHHLEWKVAAARKSTIDRFNKKQGYLITGNSGEIDGGSLRVCVDLSAI